VRLPGIGSPTPSTPFTEDRILAEGQKDGERNIPEMHSYMPAPFEQALIAHGEQEVHRIYTQTSFRIARSQPAFQTLQRNLEDIEHRLQPVADGYRARAQELGRDAAAPFPPLLHWALIVFLGIGEFPLNTVVFRLFGEAEYLTYVMASTLAIMIPLIGVFIGIHLRHSIPRVAGNIVIGALAPLTVFQTKRGRVKTTSAHTNVTANAKTTRRHDITEPPVRFGRGTRAPPSRSREGRHSHKR